MVFIRIFVSIGLFLMMSVVMLFMLFFFGKRDIEGKYGVKRIIVIDDNVIIGLFDVVVY